MLFSKLLSRPSRSSRLTSSVKTLSFTSPHSLKPSLNCMLSQSELFPWLSIILQLLALIEPGVDAF